MRLPNKIDILGDIFEIIYTENVDQIAMDKGSKVPKQGSTYLGYFNMQDQTIHIDSALNDKNKARILLHEVIEILTKQLIINITHDDIERLEHGLFYVLEKNKFTKE